MKIIYSRIILFCWLIISLFIIACGTHKKSFTGFLQNETEAAVSKTETSTVDSSSKAATFASTVETANVEKQEYESEVRIEFDTEKPVNDDTGLPPVKSITTKGLFK
jgi:hypothetical protein